MPHQSQIKPAEPMHIISLGAGVQSSTMALMAAHGEIAPMPTAAIFADTGDEPQQVYEWLAWLETQLPFPVHRVSAGILSEASTRLRKSAAGNIYTKPGLPVFFKGGDGIGSRQCTENFKIVPIRKKLREIRVNRRVIQWIGISRDEVIRMKPSRDKWCTNIWPLVDAGMRRDDCLIWMSQHGFSEPPRSSCVYCPHHSNREWKRLRETLPTEFEKAALFEERLQESYKSVTRCDATPFLHRSCVPLRQVDLSTDIERGQGELIFGNECTGLCGV